MTPIRKTMFQVRAVMSVSFRQSQGFFPMYFISPGVGDEGAIQFYFIAGSKVSSAEKFGGQFHHDCVANAGAGGNALDSHRGIANKGLAAGADAGMNQFAAGDFD